MKDGASAVASRFPDRRRTIQALVVSDEAFRGLCADFEVAEQALRRWRVSTSTARDARCAEYQELVESLADEIAAYLDAAGDLDVRSER